MADLLGLDGDAGAAYRRLCRGAPPSAIFDSVNIRNDYMASAALSPEAWALFDKAVSRNLDLHLPAEVPTAYEDPGFYLSLSLTYDQLKGALEQSGISNAHLPLIATLASGNVNAKLILDQKSGANIIFVERGLFRYFYEFAIVLGWCLPPIAINHLIDDAELGCIPGRYTMPPQASAGFRSLLCSYVVEGTPWARDGKASGRPSHNTVLTSFLLSMMELFAFSHEFSHFHLHHLEHPYTDKESAWEQEFAADRLGLQLLLLAGAGISRAALFWAADLALTALQFLDLMLASVAFGFQKVTWISKTHPDAISRRQRLRDTLAGLELDFSELETEVAQMLCRMSDALLQRLWEITSSMLLLQIQVERPKPSPMWNDRIRSCFEVHPKA